jgi:hypothetical protein
MIKVKFNFSIAQEFARISSIIKDKHYQKSKTRIKH